MSFNITAICSSAISAFINAIALFIAKVVEQLAEKNRRTSLKK